MYVANAHSYSRGCRGGLFSDAMAAAASSAGLGLVGPLKWIENLRRRLEESKAALDVPAPALKALETYSTPEHSECSLYRFRLAAI